MKILNEKVIQTSDFRLFRRKCFDMKRGKVDARNRPSIE